MRKKEEDYLIVRRGKLVFKLKTKKFSELLPGDVPLGIDPYWLIKPEKERKNRKKQKKY